jgi:hypothetical protein
MAWVGTDPRRFDRPDEDRSSDGDDVRPGFTQSPRRTGGPAGDVTTDK